MSLLVIRGDQVVERPQEGRHELEHRAHAAAAALRPLIAPVAGLSDDLTVHIEFRCSNSTTEFPITNKPHPTHGGEITDFAIVPVNVDVFDPDGVIPGLAGGGLRGARSATRRRRSRRRCAP